MRFAIDGETGHGDGGVEFKGGPHTEPQNISPGQLDPTHKPGHEQGSAFVSDSPTTPVTMHLRREIDRIRASANPTEPTD